MITKSTAYSIRSATIYLAGLVYLVLFAHAYTGETTTTAASAPTPQPVEAKLLNGNTLLLLDINGWIDAPGNSFSWVSTEDPATKTRAFMAVDKKHGEFFLVASTPNPTGSADPPNAEFMNKIKDVERKKMAQQGYVVLSEADETLDCPTHGKLPGFKFNLKLPTGELYLQQFVVNTGGRLVALANYSKDGKPSANFVKFAGSLQFEHTKPPYVRPPTHEIWLYSIGFTLFGAGIGWAVQFIMFRVHKKSLKLSQCLIGVCAWVWGMRYGIHDEEVVEKAVTTLFPPLGFLIFMAITFARKPKPAPFPIDDPKDEQGPAEGTQ